MPGSVADQIGAPTNPKDTAVASIARNGQQIQGAGTPDWWQNYQDASKNLAPIDPQVYDVYNKLRDQASDFRSSLPGLEEKRMNNVEEQGRQGLSESIAGVRQGASKRGLLYGGMEQGAETSTNDQFAKQMAQDRMGVNEQANKDTQMANEMDMDAMNMGFQIRNLEQDRYDLVNNELTFNAGQSAQGIAGIAGAAGNLIGAGMNAYGMNAQRNATNNLAGAMAGMAGGGNSNYQVPGYNYGMSTEYPWEQ